MEKKNRIRTGIIDALRKYRTLNPAGQFLAAVITAVILGVAAQLIIQFMPTGALVWWKSGLRSLGIAAAYLLKLCGMYLRIVIFSEAAVFIVDCVRSRVKDGAYTEPRPILSPLTKAVLLLSIPAMCFLGGDLLSESRYIRGLDPTASEAIASVMNGASYLLLIIGAMAFVFIAGMLIILDSRE